MLTPDQFAKNVLREALRFMSTAETEVEVLHATQKIDFYTFPDPAWFGELSEMGLLGELAAVSAMFEVFWNTPSLERIRRCMAKQLAWHHELERRARVCTHESPEAVVFPWLNILTTGRPNSVLEAFVFQMVRPGVYEAAAGLCMRIIVISELTRNRETLLLRLFGREQVLTDALVDLDELPVDSWERVAVTRVLNGFDFDGTDSETNQEAEMTRAEHVRFLIAAFRRIVRRQALAKQAEREVTREILLWRLERRFGNLPAVAKVRILGASEVRLHRWADRVLCAETLDQVFAPPRTGLFPKTVLAGS
ncbi:MAG TPA: hypothetical protein PK156_05065 [Polyangium sp.]|nr:hypothetical protein [Polyangium sp.]